MLEGVGAQAVALGEPLEGPADRQADVAHGGLDEDPPEAHLLDELVETHVGEDASGQAHRLSVDVRDALGDHPQDVALEQVLDRAGDLGVGPVPEARLTELAQLAPRLVELGVALVRPVRRVHHEEVRPAAAARPDLVEPALHLADEPGLGGRVGREPGHLARVAVRVEAEERGHVLVVVSERELGVEEAAPGAQASVLAAEDPRAERVADAVHGDHLGLVEARLEVGAGRVTGVVVDEVRGAAGEEGSLVAPRPADRRVRELAEALRVDVLEAPVGGVVDREARLAQEALPQGQPAAHGLGALHGEALGDPRGRALGPAALHLLAREALLRRGEARAALGVEEHDAGFVAAVVSDQHGNPTG